MRVGIGYDVHRLVDGRRLVLGGVEVPYGRGLVGHSDADVVVHAVIDALLGASALGDIGTHFPDDDPKYQGISSIALLQKIGGLLKAGGWFIGNIDATILCQRPKLSPYYHQMRQIMGEALGIGSERVSVKAKTTEGLGAVGREEGIAAYAVALVQRRPDEGV